MKLQVRVGHLHFMEFFWTCNLSFSCPITTLALEFMRNFAAPYDEDPLEGRVNYLLSTLPPACIIAHDITEASHV